MSASNNMIDSTLHDYFWQELSGEDIPEEKEYEPEDDPKCDFINE